MLTAYKIVIDPETIEPVLIMATDNVDESIYLMEKYSGAEYEITRIRDNLPWYGVKGIVGIYLKVSTGATKLVEQWPPKRPTVMTLDEWGYASALASLPK